MDAKIASDETAVITAGMVITGDVSSEGSMDLVGTINGNIDILGKLNITGYINGNSKAAEIFAEGAKNHLQKKQNIRQNPAVWQN